jgi:hypothetical protein
MDEARVMIWVGIVLALGSVLTNLGRAVWRGLGPTVAARAPERAVWLEAFGRSWAAAFPGDVRGMVAAYRGIRARLQFARSVRPPPPDPAAGPDLEDAERRARSERPTPVAPRVRTPPLPALLALLALAGCGATPVRQQSAVADAMARAFNRARPLLITAYEADGRAAIDAACCDRAAMVAALAAHDRRWALTRLAFESARIAHDAWRLELEACRRATDGGTCPPRVAALAARFATALAEARCAVRAVGRAELDPLPGEPACATDGGAP